jgi:DNA-binding NarL/FixJ family response regulator
MLVCSMHDESLYAERALHAGAMGYINKEQAIDEVVDAIRQVLAGRVYLSSDMAERILHRARGGDAALHVSPVDALTDRELEVFELFGKGLSSADIAERLHISTKTVDAHRQKIKRKLDLKSSAELVQHAVQWVLEATGASRQNVLQRATD